MKKTMSIKQKKEPKEMALPNIFSYIKYFILSYFSKLTNKKHFITPAIMIIVFSLFFIGNLNAATCITPDAVQSNYGGGTNTQSFTAPAGTSMVIIVTSYGRLGNSVSSISFGTGTIIQIGTTVISSTAIAAMYWCANPPSGANNLTVTLSDPVSSVVGIQAYKNVDKPINFVGVPTASKDIVMNVTTSNADSYVVFGDTAAQVNLSFSSGTGTQQWISNNSDITSEGGYLDAPSAGAYTITRICSDKRFWEAGVAAELPQKCATQTVTQTVT
ncbi:MAG: hypothetical protein WCJ46_00730, partial [bacterium]